VAERARAVVAGNHEHGVAGLLDLDWFNDRARAAAEWTRRRLDDDHLAWLATRPLVLETDDATLVHASPARPAEWDYLISAEEGYEAFPAFATRVCFVGHSHRPGAWSVGSSGRVWEPGATEIELEPGRRYLVNVGSVGQPRDGDPRAAYALWDVAGRRVTIERVPYDLATARRKILGAGLPRFLAERLTIGA
jgi:diadenosine tetraphosphatase ApaH/serine/threonine PP2A family protein phosphatase